MEAHEALGSRLFDQLLEDPTTNYAEKLQAIDLVKKAFKERMATEAATLQEKANWLGELAAR